MVLESGNRNNTVAQPIRVGLVGCGTVANYGHLPALGASPDFDLVAVCDLHLPNAEREAVSYGCRAFSSYTDMLDHADLDALVITTFEDTHPEIARAAAQAGVHVFCEKPLANNLADAEAMVQDAESNGVVFNTNFILRTGDAARGLRELDLSKLGTLEVVRIHALWDMHGFDGAMGGARRIRNLQYGALSCGIHDIDLIGFLSGRRIETVNASGISPELDDYGPPGHILVSGMLEGGVLYSMEASCTLGRAGKTRTGIWRYDLMFDRGYTSFVHELGGEPEIKVVDDMGTHTVKLPGFREKNWTRAYELLAERVRNGPDFHNDLATGRDGLEAHYVCELAHQQVLAGGCGLSVGSLRSEALLHQ